MLICLPGGNVGGVGKGGDGVGNGGNVGNGGDGVGHGGNCGTVGTQSNVHFLSLPQHVPLPVNKQSSSLLHSRK